MEEKYILTLDVGTTTIRSLIFNSRAEIVGKGDDQVFVEYPKPGYCEIDPEVLWSTILNVINISIKNASLTAGQMSAMGISTQRSTFITWSKKTGKPFHNFITWKDLRADKLVKQWNQSFTWRMFKAGAYILYLLLRSSRFKTGSSLKLMNTQSTVRFLWALQNNAQLKTAVQEGDAMFGTLDTWLLHRLTGGKIHMTDVSSASATGFFDPFTMQWASWAVALFRLPTATLPEVVDTAGDHFGATDPKLWGHAIPIIASMADQTSAMWGACCFEVGDVKLTMGTGTFIDVNTGKKQHASASGLYPVVAWRVGKDLVYSAEASNNDTATIVKWAQKLGLFERPEDSADIANSVPDSDGVCFIPAFSGLGAPYMDATAASGFIGMNPTTTKAHLVRALLESLAFRTAQIIRCARIETNFDFHTVRLDGGVSNNDFIAQLIADLTGLRLERPVSVEMSSLGCAHIIGIHLGIWKSKDELKSLRNIARVFTPRAHVRKAYESTFTLWESAVERLCGWYEDRDLHSTSSSSAKCADGSEITDKIHTK